MLQGPCASVLAHQHQQWARQLPAALATADAVGRRCVPAVRTTQAALQAMNEYYTTSQAKIQQLELVLRDTQQRLQQLEEEHAACHAVKCVITRPRAQQQLSTLQAFCCVSASLL